MLCGLSWLRRGIATGLACGLLLISACNKSSGDGVKFAHTYGGSYETSAAFSYLAQKVTFTIAWNESGGTITGFYQDDYFAPAGVAISGTTTGGATTFIVALAAAKDGVSTLDFSIHQTTSGLVASVTGKSSTGVSVFADSDVALESKSTGAGGTGDPTTVAGFFAKLAGEYDWIATRGGGSDDQWTAGETYKIKISADKKISLPSNDGDVEVVFGEKAEDSFESYDHESYIIATRGECKYLLQYQVEQDETFLTCSKGNDITSPFWKFSKEGGTSTGVLAELGIGGAAGKHAWVVKSASAGNDTAYTAGAEFKFTIDEDANITSDLGDFTYSDENYAAYTVSSNGSTHVNATWYNPGKGVVPRKEFIIDADADKLISLIIKDYRANNVTITYVIGETYP